MKLKHMLSKTHVTASDLSKTVIVIQKKKKKKKTWSYFHLQTSHRQTCAHYIAKNAMKFANYE